MLTQISIFLPNRPGMLAEMTKFLQEKKINLQALTVADTVDYGILRIIVDKPKECSEILKEKNYLISETEVLAIEVPDRPGALHEIAKTLGDEKINIAYLYSFVAPQKKAIIVLRVDDSEEAKKILKKKFNLLESIT
ncbi:MAG: ACT domain-containing protein [Candidatus Helarchaeota archaeon]